MILFELIGAIVKFAFHIVMFVLNLVIIAINALAALIVAAPLVGIGLIIFLILL